MKSTNSNSGWHFTGNNGDFIHANPQQTSYLYFPLANEAGMMASITPLLHGDIKNGQNSFLMIPVSTIDLHVSRAARNFWIYLENVGAWSATGNSAPQTALNFEDGEPREQVTMTGGFLWHQLTRINSQLGIKAEITNFVPANGAFVELMRVKITNIRQVPVKITPTAAIPIYGRSADNLRDHRHVTSLLHRIRTTVYGVEVCSTLCFNERGHTINQVFYGVLGADQDGKPPIGFFPVMDDFIGEGGTLDWPEKVVKNSGNFVTAGQTATGCEAIGGLRFADSILAAGESKSYIMALVIKNDYPTMDEIAREYCSEKAFEEHLHQTKDYWNLKLNRLTFTTGDDRFSQWTKWVAIQPILRKIYGCSFMPHHDYGRGGRGWRDLWQDCLALLILEPADVRSLLWNNFAGVRIDGSNATIIGSEPGEFIADRNSISRVWMDHGAWPFFTVKLYLDETGDYQFLLEEQTYFKDHQIYRSQCLDPDWSPEQGNKLLQLDGSIYHGSILEHILVQNLTQFFNVGDHNNIRLEGADWNDALDMAAKKGESVAFTAFYGWNLLEIADLLQDLKEKSELTTIDLAEEITVLLDYLSKKVDYDSVSEKQRLLYDYFDTVKHQLTGRKVSVELSGLITDLRQKAGWIFNHLRTREWIKDAAGFQWFNGYYDNAGERVEGDHQNGVRMTLTGQVFAIMGGVAEDDQVAEIIQSVNRYLKDPRLGSYRLNTDFAELKINLGRAFGFAFGQKENGAIFSHMVVMYGYALYKRGFVQEGHAVLKSLYNLAGDFEKGRIYPGIPEYFNNEGRGMYHYLTGSASWYLLTLRNEVFGVRGFRGDMILEPKLLREQFDEVGNAAIQTVFAGHQLKIVYRNIAKLDYGRYRIKSIRVNDRPVQYSTHNNAAIIERYVIEQLSPDNHLIVVELE